jgi:hypothetical protein
MPLDHDAIRQGMYFSMVADGSLYSVPELLDPARRKWIVLQVRQLQRLALETLLSWCERKVLDGAHDTARLTELAELAFRTRGFGLAPDGGISGIIGALDAQISSPDQFVALGRADKRYSPFALMEEISAAARIPDDGVAALCLYALLVCASFAGSFGDAERHLISAGGPSRLSLYHLRKRLIALGDATLRQAIQFVIEAMVVSQHFATAVNRFDGQNQRLRLSIEEAGLIPLVAKPWEPAVTEDRLPTLMRLAADCALIRAQGDMFYL